MILFRGQSNKKQINAQIGHSGFLFKPTTKLAMSSGNCFGNFDSDEGLGSSKATRKPSRVPRTLRGPSKADSPQSEFNVLDEVELIPNDASHPQGDVILVQDPQKI
jgi:hypothetical protein